MMLDEFRATLTSPEPPGELPAPLAALWWDAKGDWAHAHGIVDDLETLGAMAVHAYLHRKEGVDWNADYWYSGRARISPAHARGRVGGAGGGAARRVNTDVADDRV